MPETGVRIAPNLTLPLDIVTETVAILAKRRAGKSYTARKLAEQLLSTALRVVIVDPKGDWWGLRSSADGKQPGFPILIAGGEHSDVPLEPNAGEVLARFVVEQRVNLLLDLSSFRKHEVATFMTGFLEALYRLKAREEFRTPMMLVVDEADAIAPQRPQKGEERMLGAAEDIVRRGGQRGIGCTLISQRSAVLNKNVLTQAQVLIALRTMSPQDLAALDAWIEVHGSPQERKVLFDSLPSLPVGDAWVWSPGWPTARGIFQRIHVALIETFDSGATPKVGQKITPPKSLAEVDLGALKDSMAATIAKAKADDPRELRKRIADLERQMAQRPTETKVETKIERVEVPAVSAADLDRFAELIGGWRSVQASFESLLLDAQNVGNRLDDGLLKSRDALRQPLSAERLQGLSRAERAKPVPRISPVPREHQRPPPHSVAPRPEQTQVATDWTPAAVHQKILDALATFESLGVRPAPRPSVGALAGYSAGSGHFKNAIGALRSRALITYPNADSLELTDAGRAIADPSADIRTVNDLHQAWYRLLDRAQTAILGVLIESYPEPISREQLGERSGYSPTSGHFKNVLGSLRTMRIADYPDASSVIATELLFPALLQR